jgi:CheY-like chemotaxis protein
MIKTDLTRNIANSQLLIVDDSPENITMISETLKKEGYKIKIATNGQQALKSIKGSLPDLILLDVLMPGLSGYEVCEQIKADPATEEIPVIFLTAESDSESLVKGFTMGAVDYITKPFEPSELLIRVQTHLKLEWQRKELEKTNAEKDKLFSIVAHDIKNPFTSIITGIELIQPGLNKLENPKLLERINALLTQINSVTEISTNLLQWARSSAKVWIPNFQEVNINESVQNAITFYEVQAANKQISIVNSVDKTLTASVDKEQFEIIFRNLVSNALKFSKTESEIRITSEQTENSCTVSVTDMGTGMDEEVTKNLFNIHNKQTRRGTQNEAGTGLGMLIIKDLIEANNCKFFIESQPDKGTAASVLIPLI